MCAVLRAREDLFVKIIEITDQFITRNDPVIVIKRKTKYTTLSEHFINQINKNGRNRCKLGTANTRDHSGLVQTLQ
jgi:hypothetical protein